MFSIFKKDPKAKLQARYEQLLADALNAQRKGDIKTYSSLIAQSEEVAEAIDRL